MAISTTGKLVLILWIPCIVLAQGIEKPVSLSVHLDPGVLSENVDIKYVLEGPFGIRGDFVRAIANTVSYAIPTSVGGVPAKRVQMVIWAPGCETKTYDLKLARLTTDLSYDCVFLPDITVTGRIQPAELVHRSRTEIAVWYEEFWQCSFFGWADCSVPQINVAVVQPDADGNFELRLPDFALDPIPSRLKWSGIKNAYRVVLRDRETWNAIATLMPELESLRSSPDDLQVLSAYPSDLVFVAATCSARTPSPKQQ